MWHSFVMAEMRAEKRPDFEVVVIGAGLAGLYAGMKLKEAGIDFLIAEKSGEVGGTWKVNRYPGVAVDVNSFNYSYRGVRYHRWTRAFAPGKEVAAYAEHLADAFDLRPHIRFHTRIAEAHWDARAHVWRLSLGDGASMTCRYLIQAPGGLTQPKRPNIAGISDFRGTVMHTAEWDDSVNLEGKRVAVIGTGASAVQVVPSIAPRVATLSVFQRTPIWVMPKLDFPITPRMQRIFEKVPGAFDATRIATSLPSTVFFRLGTIHAKRVPFLQRVAQKLAKRHLERQVKTPALREKLLPAYGFGCKRPAVSNEYLRTFERENVSLVTDPIDHIDARGVVTKDGVLHEIDVLILATGFNVFELGNAPPYPVHGEGGVELGRFWHENRYQAYEACTVPAWPNMFLLTGPYGLGGRSYLAMVEAATRHSLRVITEAHRRGATYAAVRQDAHDAYFQDVLRRQEKSVFQNGTCSGSNSYYYDRHGDAPAMRPHLGFEIALRSHFSPLSHYDFKSAPQPVVAPTQERAKRTPRERAFEQHASA
jgi:cation diffusion facilitator CzcD-associated flavoprotein CzcO